MRTPLAMLSSPRSIGVSPASIRSSVVLPAPLRPAIVIRSRRSSLNETPRSSGCPAMSLCMSDAINNAIALRDTRAPGAPLASAPMRGAKTTLVLWALALPFLLAPIAEAANNGRGFYGETNDKVVTDAGFILIVFFPLFVFCMSMLQKALDKRKEARKAAHKSQLSNAQWRGGW